MKNQDDKQSCAKVTKPSTGPISIQKSPNLACAAASPFGSEDKGLKNYKPPCSNNAQSADKFLSPLAATIAAQPIGCPDPEVWGVLTAISAKARQHKQGMDLHLTKDEHIIGRLVEDASFQILTTTVSAHHCKIFRKKVATENTEPDNSCYSVFLKDSSTNGTYFLKRTNGTYLNQEKLTKSSSEAKLQHGDIISIPHPPQHDLAYAFVYREVKNSSDASANNGSLKRKLEEYGTDKRLKGIGIGASTGLISLERSNMEMRELKESVSKFYLDQLLKLNQSLEAKDKELTELNKTLAEQKHGIEDLNEKLSASKQSYHEANEIINSQKASISELKALLDEERDRRREERGKASEDIKMAIQKVQAEAAKEIKQLSDGAVRREKELLEMIKKLQDAEKEWCLLVKDLRSKLEDTILMFVNTEDKVCLLKGQIHQEQKVSADRRKRVEELEHERIRLKKEFEHEKAAREEAWAKVSALAFDISAAMRDLDFERCRLKGARERIMLRETQLRAFYSTTEEISVLFGKQQEQLKAMQKTLEDEENYENTSFDVVPNPYDDKQYRSMVRDIENIGTHHSKSVAKTGHGSLCTDQFELSSHEVSAMEKHDCNSNHEVEFPSDANGGGFGSDINGVDTAPVLVGDAVGTKQISNPEVVGSRHEAASDSYLILLAEVAASSQNLEWDGDNEEDSPWTFPD